MTIPAHLQTAREITGTLEASGSADNPVILGWATEIGRRFPDMADYCRVYTHDSIPWCGLTVAYCLAHNGIRPVYGDADTDRFLWARAWAHYGNPVSSPEPGDILVFDGHVSFYEGTDGDYYLCRGGNQSDAVNTARYPRTAVIAIRRPTLIPLAKASKPPIPVSSRKRQTGITATVFGGEDDPNESAYDEHDIDDDELGVALPYRFPGARPRVRVYNGDRSVECAIVDVGPWNTSDPYWDRNARPQAESGTDKSGRTTNRAGIDLTPAAARALGIQGKGLVDWEFIGTAKDTGTLSIQGWVKRACETVATAAVSFAGTLQLTDKQSAFNLAVVAAIVTLAVVVWFVAHKTSTMPAKVPPKPVVVPVQKWVPPAAPRSIEMNPIFAQLLQQVLGAVLTSVTQPQAPSVPGTVPTEQPAPASDGTVEHFMKNLLTAVLMAAAAEIMKELPRLMTPKQ